MTVEPEFLEPEMEDDEDEFFEDNWEDYCCGGDHSDWEDEDDEDDDDL